MSYKKFAEPLGRVIKYQKQTKCQMINIRIERGNSITNHTSIKRTIEIPTKKNKCSPKILKR